MDATGKKFSKYLIVAILLYYSLAEIDRFVFHIDPLIKPQYIKFFIDYLFIGIIFKYFLINYKIYNFQNSIIKFFKLYFIYYTFVTLFSLASPENNYWDYKYIFTVSLPFIIFGLVFIIGFNISNITYFIKTYTNFIFPFTLFLFFWNVSTYPELITRLLLPISFIMLFFIHLKPISKIFIIVLCFIIIFYDPTLRVNILNILISFFLLIIYFLKIQNKFINKIIYFGIIFVPFLFLFLFYSYNFDIFNFVSNYLLNEDNIEFDISNTRSILYKEVFYSIKSISDIIFGQGLNAFYVSDVFSGASDVIFNEGRFQSEVGFLDLILKNGILGFFIFSFFYIYPSYLAIFNSNNLLSKILGFKLLSYWILLFVEYYQTVNISYFIIFFLAGFLSSNEFRQLEEKDLNKLIK